MKSPNAKLVLSIFAVVAMLTSPAFAKKAPQATYNNGSAAYGSIVGSPVDGSPVYSAIPGYDSDGDVVAIPDPDQSGASQR
jgi:hypothetical protein